MTISVIIAALGILRAAAGLLDEVELEELLALLDEELLLGIDVMPEELLLLGGRCLLIAGAGERSGAGGLRDLLRIVRCRRRSLSLLILLGGGRRPLRDLRLAVVLRHRPRGLDSAREQREEQDQKRFGGACHGGGSSVT